MNDKMKNTLENLRNKVQSLDKKVKIIIAGGVAIVIALIFVLALSNGNKGYETLFTGLTNEECTEIMGKLQADFISYKVEEEGTILVPSENVDSVKAKLVYEGYPKSGFTYDMFKDNVNLMTTDSEKLTYKIFELEKRIGATIRLFDGVKDAKVIIALGEDSRYVLTEKQKAESTAAVTVIMKDGKSPTKEQVNGIRNLVAKSIPNLKPENVTITDGNGRDVTEVDVSDAQSALNKLKMEIESTIEKNISEKIVNVLVPIYGEGNVNVSVKGTVDIDKKIREITNYEAPPNVEDKKGIPSKITSEGEMAKNGETAEGVPGAETNADIPIYTTKNPDGTESYWRNKNAVEYLVNELKEQSQTDTASLKDLTVSVIINAKNYGGVDKRELIDIIGKAAGISPESQEEKIALLSTPYYEPEEEDAQGVPQGEDRTMLYAAGFGLLFLIILLLIIIFIIKRRKKMSRYRELKEQEKLLRIQEEESRYDLMRKELEKKKESDKEKLDLLNLQNEKGLELKENIRDFTEKNPEISAQLLKTWLRGGDDKNVK